MDIINNMFKMLTSCCGLNNSISRDPEMLSAVSAPRGSRHGSVGPKSVRSTHSNGRRGDVVYGPIPKHMKGTDSKHSSVSSGTSHYSTAKSNHSRHSSVRSGGSKMSGRPPVEVPTSRWKRNKLPGAYSSSAGSSFVHIYDPGYKGQQCSFVWRDFLWVFG